MIILSFSRKSFLDYIRYIYLFICMYICVMYWWLISWGVIIIINPSYHQTPLPPPPTFSLPLFQRGISHHVYLCVLNYLFPRFWVSWHHSPFTCFAFQHTTKLHKYIKGLHSPTATPLLPSPPPPPPPPPPIVHQLYLIIFC